MTEHRDRKEFDRWLHINAQYAQWLSTALVTDWWTKICWRAYLKGLRKGRNEG